MQDPAPVHSRVMSGLQPSILAIFSADSVGDKSLTFNVKSAPNSCAISKRQSIISVTTTFEIPAAFTVSKVIRPIGPVGNVYEVLLQLATLRFEEFHELLIYV